MIQSQQPSAVIVGYLVKTPPSEAFASLGGVGFSVVGALVGGVWLFVLLDSGVGLLLL